jgi:hypothetical protein
MGGSKISDMDAASLPLTGEMVPCVQDGANVQVPAAALGVPVAGLTPPATPTAYQSWIDESTAPPTLRLYLGGNWTPLYTIDTDGTLGLAQPLTLPAEPASGDQAATKSYDPSVVFKGVIDCSANPNYPAARLGDFHVVSVAGKIGGASGVTVRIGDTLLCRIDNSPSGSQASVGANWTIGQGSVANAAYGPASATLGDFALFDGTSGKAIKDGPLSFDTDPAMAANSDANVPSQKAVRSALGGVVLGDAALAQGQGWIFDGATDAFRARDGEGENLLVNSAFDIWQENTSYTLNTIGNKLFIADFWKLGSNGTGTTKTITRVAGLSGARYALKAQRVPGSTDITHVRLAQQFGQSESLFLAGKTVVVSFDFVAGADFSGQGPAATIYYGTGIDEDFVMTGLGPHFPTGAGNTGLGTPLSVAPAGQVARLISPPLAIPTGVTEIACDIHAGPYLTGAAGADDSFTIGNIKLEIGNAATPYVRPDPGDELRRCQRRYWKTFLSAAVPGDGPGLASGEHRAAATKAGAVAQTLGMVRFPAMRAAPSVSLFNPAPGGAAGQARDLTAAADCSATAAQNLAEGSFEIVATGAASTARGNTLGVHVVADARL